MKVAIVHPMFLDAGGGERVVDTLADMYPNADIFVLCGDSESLSSHLRGRRIYKSRLDKLARLSRLLFNRQLGSLMPLFPWAIESLDVSGYDLVLSSCGQAVMGVNVGQDAVHIAYVHTPQTAWWHLYAQRQALMSWIPRQLYVACATFVRMWEFCAMQRVDYVVSNSNYISHRVSKYFSRKSTVIYPPVNTSWGYLSNRHDDYYLSVSRLYKAKRIDILIRACSQLKRRLLVVGSGREEGRLKAIAGPTIEFVGRVPDGRLPELYANCRAFLFAADEDFGIAPVEAQAFGRPVIAYGHGGSLETVRVGDPEGRSDTGVFFPEQTVESVIEGIQRFEVREECFLAQEIQQHARQFDTAVFIEKMRKFVDIATGKE